MTPPMIAAVVSPDLAVPPPASSFEAAEDSGETKFSRTEDATTLGTDAGPEGDDFVPEVTASVLGVVPGTELVVSTPVAPGVVEAGVGFGSAVDVCVTGVSVSLGLALGVGEVKKWSVVATPPQAT